MFPLFLIISSFIWRHLLCPFTQHISSMMKHSTFHHIPLLLNSSHASQCLFFSSVSSGSSSFYFYIPYKVTCLQAVYFLPYLFFLFTPSECVYVTHALRLVKVISYCADPSTALKITNSFSMCYSLLVDHTSRNHEGVPLMS